VVEDPGDGVVEDEDCVGVAAGDEVKVEDCVDIAVGDGVVELEEGVGVGVAEEEVDKEPAGTI